MDEEIFETALLKELGELVTVTGRTKEEVIVRLCEGVTRKQLFAALANMEHVEIEHFETYKPSLNDIFVAKVGEEE